MTVTLKEIFLCIAVCHFNKHQKKFGCWGDILFVLRVEQAIEFQGVCIWQRCEQGLQIWFLDYYPWKSNTFIYERCPAGLTKCLGSYETVSLWAPTWRSNNFIPHNISPSGVWESRVWDNSSLQICLLVASSSVKKLNKSFPHLPCVLFWMLFEHFQASLKIIFVACWHCWLNLNRIRII